MKRLLVNWKTTAAGLAAILGGAAHILNGVATGDFTFSGLSVDLGVIGGGFGLLFAKDGNVTGGTTRQS